MVDVNDQVRELQRASAQAMDDGDAAWTWTDRHEELTSLREYIKAVHMDVLAVYLTVAAILDKFNDR